MHDEFDYDPPKGPLDCCSGMSRHGRLLQEARTPLRLPPVQPAGTQQRRLNELMQQLKRQPQQPDALRG